MKIKNLLLAIFMCSSSFVFSQWTVHDPTNAVNMSKQIETSTQQVTQLEKTVEYMKKAEEKLSQVNGLVQNIDEIKEIMLLQKQSLRYANIIKNKKLPTIKDPQYIRQIVSNTTNSLQTINSSIKFINNILTNGFFKMSDAERINLIENQREKVFTQYAKLMGQAQPFH